METIKLRFALAFDGAGNYSVTGNSWSPDRGAAMERAAADVYKETGGSGKVRALQMEIVIDVPPVMMPDPGPHLPTSEPS